MPKNESDPNMSSAEHEYKEVISVSLHSRISPFWRELPRIWFTQFESITAPQKLSQETKFDLVISKLGKEELCSVSDLLEETPRNFSALKTRLIAECQESSDQQFDRLINEPQLGEQRPSQLYRRMAAISKNANVDIETVKKLWLRRLPIAVRTALIAQDEKDSEKMIALADRIAETSRQGIVAELKTTVPNESDTDLVKEIRDMAAQFQQLRGEVSEIKRQEKPGSGPRANWYSQPNRVPFSSAPRRQNVLCNYHRRFGRFARNCQRPCSWQDRGPSGQFQGSSKMQTRQGN